MEEWTALGGPRYTLERRQWVPRAVEEVAAFFEEPRNLQRMTPHTIDFRILRIRPERIEAGMVIDYRIRVLGFPFSWRSVIREYRPGQRFTDVQTRGPYALWEHEHSFEPVAGGTTVRDRVTYRMPFGPLGMLVHWLFVKRQLAFIFDFRARVMAGLFGEGRIMAAPPAAATTEGAATNEQPHA